MALVLAVMLFLLQSCFAAFEVYTPGSGDVAMAKGFGGEVAYSGWIQACKGHKFFEKLD